MKQPDIFAAHWMRHIYLNRRLLADVRPLSLDRIGTFLTVAIQHQRCYCVASGDGLFLDHRWHHGRHPGVTVVTTIRGELTSATETSTTDLNWMMDNQPAGGLLSLSRPLNLSGRGRQALAHTFGRQADPTVATVPDPEQDRPGSFLLPVTGAARLGAAAGKRSPARQGRCGTGHRAYSIRVRLGLRRFATALVSSAATRQQLHLRNFT